MSEPPIDARVLEPATDRAWRAAAESAQGGWRLKASAGFSGRINSCWPLAEPGLPADEAIDSVEAWFRERGIAPRFKLADRGFEPPDLPARLAARGFTPTTPTLVMTGKVEGRRDERVRLVADLDPRFLDVFLSAAADPGDAQERLEALGRTPAPRAFALAMDGGTPAAIGACAVEAPFVGLFAMRTHLAFRRRGFAQAILETLLAFASDEGASLAWLQVEADNAPARRLYDLAGFIEAYRYVYWRRLGAG